METLGSKIPLELLFGVCRSLHEIPLLQASRALNCKEKRLAVTSNWQPIPRKRRMKNGDAATDRLAWPHSIMIAIIENRESLALHHSTLLIRIAFISDSSDSATVRHH